ncbi:glycosyltransferase 87 family protein [Allokutzneria albata]|uniref:Alpha-1,2-mannosyltransferase n=1 Tax=Allokutzneria albata TaxID=211114 RepID=A0A1G9SEU1_ALLAB|nr:glycosyltransferase 87 family protein [Allokutzneria albata]SDM33998.1 alpha-1,2-mannosyltransferase [Allokutzneria albata]
MRNIFVLAATLATVVLAAVLVTLGHPLLDFQVYRAGGQAWLRGQELYGPGFPYDATTVRWPFTYPPFAAIVLSAVTLPSWPVATTAMTVAGALALAATCVAVTRRVRPGPAATRLGCALALGCLLLEPVSKTLSMGQINLVLMALVAADCLVARPRWPRGLLIGIAAAIKLTPAVFVLYFLATGQRRPAMTAGAAFLAASLVAFVLAPADSARYWFHTLADTGRIGPPIFADNQSLHGLLARFSLPSPLPTVLWLTLVGVVLAAVWTTCRRLRQRGHDVAALLVVALAGLLCSPVSWGHHWVWIAPAAVALCLHRPGRRAAVIATSGLVPFLVGAYRFLRGDEQNWSVAEHLVGNAYVVVGVAVLGGAWWCHGRPRRSAARRSGRVSTHREATMS